MPVYNKMPVKKAGKPSNTLMLGAYMEILNQDNELYYQALIYKKEYWILKSDTTDKNEVLKLYFVDVGQGDGMLIEANAPWLLALSDRNEIFYAPTTGLVDIAYAVKKYVRSVKAITPEQYSLISGLRYRRPKKSRKKQLH